jgi:hypothetical protein
MAIKYLENINDNTCGDWNNGNNLTGVYIVIIKVGIWLT